MILLALANRRQTSKYYATVCKGRGGTYCADYFNLWGDTLARINFNDSIFHDARFLKLVILVGNPRLAIGELVWAWWLGQKWFLASDRGIPRDEWDKQACNDAIIESGLATQDGRYIKITGSEKHFGWLKQKSAAGKKSARQRTLTPVDARQPPYSSLSSLNSNLFAASSLAPLAPASPPALGLLEKAEKALSPDAVEKYRALFGESYKKEVEDCWLRYLELDKSKTQGPRGFITSLRKWADVWKKEEEKARLKKISSRPINYDEDGNEIPWPDEARP